MLTDAVKQSISGNVLCGLVTVSADGRPDVSPKELFGAHGDDRELIAVAVEAVIAPSHWLFADITEAHEVARAMSTSDVKPAC
ncbi:MAG: pyridoxamine 5'-phosphate oxidase family protein [Gammaproteobacteria bacterium]